MSGGGRRKIVDERFYVSRVTGGGILRREIWVDEVDRVVRYNLAYINHLIYSGDNGRVLGYDSAHGHAHRHFKGGVTLVHLASFDEIEGRFQWEWEHLMKKSREKKYEEN
jgi:hypothetical protein